MKHFVSASTDRLCKCGARSTHKVGEEIPHDDPSMVWERLIHEFNEVDCRLHSDYRRVGDFSRLDEIRVQLAALTPDQLPRHNLTAYVCCACFTALLGSATGCPL